MTLSEVPWFIRVWSVNATLPHQDLPGAPTLSGTIKSAYEMAHNKAVRQVMVLDFQHMEWARFNMLWFAPEWEFNHNE